MKRVIFLVFIFSMISSRSYCAENTINIDNGNYYPKKYNSISADATATAVGVSMISWGVGIAAVVTTLAILIPPDEESNNHSHCSSTN